HLLDAHGALSSDAIDDLSAQASVLGVLESFVRDLCAIDEGPWPTAELHEQLRAAFEWHRRASHADAVARVRVIEATDAIGVQAGWLWVMGLSRGSFPDRPPVAFLVQPTWRRRLSRDPLTRARHGLAGWLRDALDPETPNAGGAIGRLVLSWPLTRAGRAVPPCAVLADLLDLPTADGGRLETLAAVTPDRASRRRADGPASVVDVLARAAGEARARTASDEHPWRELLPASVRDDFEVAVEVQRAREGQWGPHDGVLVDPPATSTTLSVTALESYLRCPQRYWYDRVLRLSPPDEWAPELEPRRRGTALHSILEQFFRRRGLKPVVGGDPAALGRDLHEVAREVLDEVERQGGFDPAYQAYARERWLAGLVDDAPAGILRAWLDLEIAAEDGRAPVAVEAAFADLQVGPIKLRGVLDRLDRLPDGALVVTDYKTGQPPTRASVAEGRSLQPYAYAEAAAKQFPDAAVAATFLSLARPDRLARTGWVGDPSVLGVACGPGERRYALAVDARERRQVLRDAGEQARGLLAGHFVPTRLGASRAGCATCPHARTCRVDHGRQAERVAAEEQARAQPGEAS
ncbi:MAG: PD-(D/E)XK nuclease family protein, partial [Myxococcota bacterium]